MQTTLQDRPKQQMKEELAQNTNDHSRLLYLHASSGPVQQDLISASDREDEYHEDIVQQPIRQSLEHAPKKNVPVTKAEITKHSSLNMRRDQHRNQSEIPLNKNYTHLKHRRKRRLRRPWFIWITSLIQICVFIVEMANNWSLTGSPIETKLYVNPLLGPSPYVLIQMGASFSPCMRAIKGMTDHSSIGFPCPNSTILANNKCTLSDLCGFNGVSSIPNQWYRFIIPIFLHVGIMHIGLNLLPQFVFGVEIERKIGAFRLAPIYFASGIFGFVLGGNFAPDILPRIGCSGSVFAIIALFHLDLLYNWKEMKRPGKQIIILLLCTIFDFALGLLPGIDNFSHIGGFCMGLLLGLAILGSPTNLRRRKKAKEYSNDFEGLLGPRERRKFFYNRSKTWWIWWLVRFVAFVTAIIIFVVLVENFYTERIKCTWCKYISCLPINDWCDFGRLTRNITIVKAREQK